MDGADKQSYRAAFERYGVIVLLLAAGGFFFWTGQLKTSRPPEIAPAAPEGGWVYARLWQDPVDAARQAPLEAKSAAERGQIRVAQDDLVMPVYMTGGNSASEKEDRLRTRYAVLTALEAAGYVPDDTSRLHFLRFDEPVRKASWQGPIWVPYEWLGRNPLQQARNGEGQRLPQKILVLWLDGSRLYGAPLGKLREIAGQHLTDNFKAKYRVIGPRIPTCFSRY